MRKWIARGALAAVVLLAGTALWGSRVSTPPILDDNGRPVPGSIASLERVTLGGWPQSILIRGHDTTRPFLLFLHGGPGMPAMYLAHAFQRPLEQHAVVVHWDQRGAGKSYRWDLPPSSMTVEQLLQDARDLIDQLRARFRVPKVYVVGHSWGSQLGMLLAERHPDRVAAFIGVGQVVDGAETRVIVDRFIREQALRRGRPEAIADLEARGADAHERWVFRFGGELADHTSWWPLLSAGLRAPEYSLLDVLRVKWGIDFTHGHLRDDGGDRPLRERVTELAVPVYFFEGRRDYTTPSELAVAYLAELRAPLKRVVWFEQSAHFPFFEEPDRFAAEIARVIDETRASAPGSAGEGSVQRRLRVDDGRVEQR